MPPRNNRCSLQQAIPRMRDLIAAYKPSETIRRIEIKVRPVDLLAWLSLQKDRVKIYGANQSDTMAIAGIGQAVAVAAKRTGSFKIVFKKLRSLLTLQHPYLQWYGGFCFDDHHQDADWKGFGAYRFVIPRFELAAQGGRMIFCCNLIGRENIKKILRELNKMQRVAIRQEEHVNSKAEPERVDDPDWNRWQKNVIHTLGNKSVEKIVLARKTSLFFQHAPDPWTMLAQLKKVTPNSYHFAFQFGKTVFLGASPERLYRRQGRFIESDALAGTMPKSRAPELLTRSKKNNREHALVVKAIGETFGRLCRHYQCPKRPGILTLANGHHLITKFQGQLKDGINDEDILKFLHPTPALGGSPRPQAMAAIRRLEVFSRGWYGAPVGYVGLDWAEFVVGIRSGLVRGRKLSVFAGAGIIRGSDPLDEWNEVENKISNFIKIIR